MITCYTGHTKGVSDLLDMQVDVNLSDLYGTSALSLASSQGHIESVSLLVVKEGIDVN